MYLKQNKTSYRAWVMRGKDRRTLFNLAGWGNVCYVFFGYGSGSESAENFVLMT